MIKHLALSFAAGFMFYAQGEPAFFSRCHDLFRSGPAKPRLSENTVWSSPFAKELFSFVYQQLPLLKEGLLSSSEIKKYTAHLEKLLGQLERPSDLELKGRMDLIGPHLSSAVRAFPDIVSFINSGQASKYESLDAGLTLRLALSALSRHVIAYLTHPIGERLDWERMSKILKSISDFKDQKSAFSLYKIKRAVGEKHSLYEYINCK